MQVPVRCKLVVLISGSGTNLQALIEACQNQSINADICAVLSNRADAAGLQKAQAAGIPQHIVDHTGFADRVSFDRALQNTIDHYQPDLVILAGFMRILTAEFTRHYQGRLLNIHPSLLPKYPGLHTHKRALTEGDAVHGATVHFVTDELDGGPLVLQVQVPVLPTDTETSLAQRVLTQEHHIYPLAVQWFADGRLRLQDNRALLDGEPLPDNGYLISAS